MAWKQSIALRFADLDYLGHVTAAAYLVFFDEARTSWLAELWGTPEPIYVVAQQQIEYLREVRLADQSVAVEISLVGIGRSSFDLRETLTTAAGVLTTRSRATLCAWDSEARKARELTEPERHALEPLLAR